MSDGTETTPAESSSPLPKSPAQTEEEEDCSPVRNLLYHIYPVKGSGTWQRNLDQLKPRMGLFTGRRIVAVVTDGKTDSPDKVIQYLDGFDCEFLTASNNRALREVATHGALWESIMPGRPGDVTFYAHAKGVVRAFNPGEMSFYWSWMMYHICLDYWPLVEHVLQTHATCGAFKRVGRGFAGSMSDWHFSGSFYWIRQDELAKRDWRTIDQKWFGVEPWPSLHFAKEQAFDLFNSHGYGQLNMYAHENIERTLQELQAWKAQHERQLQVLPVEPSIEDLGIPNHGEPDVVSVPGMPV